MTVEAVIDALKLKQIVEAALMAADEPLSVDQLTKLFAHGELDSEAGRAQIRETLTNLEAEAEGRGYELARVASGYRYQVRQELSEWVSRLWDEKPPRYSRALLETLALVAYKQPVTRGDIEAVRGVAVSQNIMRTLLERGWIRVVGQREVPGRPSLYGTTRAFLDYFDLRSLDQLPPLNEIRSMVEPLIVQEVMGDDDEANDPQARYEDVEVDEAGDASAETGVEPTVDFEDEQQDVEQHAREDAEEVHGEAGGERSSAPAAERSAEVVRLPTSPRR